MRKRVWIIPVLALVLGGCGSDPSSPSKSTGPSTEQLLKDQGEMGKAYRSAMPGNPDTPGKAQTIPPGVPSNYPGMNKASAAQKSGS